MPTIIQNSAFSTPMGVNANRTFLPPPNRFMNPPLFSQVPNYNGLSVPTSFVSSPQATQIAQCSKYSPWNHQLPTRSTDVLHPSTLIEHPHLNYDHRIYGPQQNLLYYPYHPHLYTYPTQPTPYVNYIDSALPTAATTTSLQSPHPDPRGQERNNSSNH
jgi:hypothetical protein